MVDGRSHDSVTHKIPGLQTLRVKSKSLSLLLRLRELIKIIFRNIFESDRSIVD